MKVIKETLPSSISFKWKTGKKNIPKEVGVYAVLCKNVKTKEEWFSFAEFIPERLPGCKIDFDRWSVLGCIPGDCFARYSEDNAFNVIAWSKMKRNEKKKHK